MMMGVMLSLYGTLPVSGFCHGDGCNASTVLHTAVRFYHDDEHNTVIALYACVVVP